MFSFEDGNSTALVRVPCKERIAVIMYSRIPLIALPIKLLSSEDFISVIESRILLVALYIKLVSREDLIPSEDLISSEDIISVI